MKTDSKKIADNVKTSKSARVPIPLTASEEKQLISLSNQESRSKQSMAGIIYRLGLKTYANGKTRS